LAAILKILKTKSTILSDDLFLCQVSKGSAVRSEFNIFCTLVTMATAVILNLFNKCFSTSWSTSLQPVNSILHQTSIILANLSLLKDITNLGSECPLNIKRRWRHMDLHFLVIIDQTLFCEIPIVSDWKKIVIVYRYFEQSNSDGVNMVQRIPFRE
jgi:hypothetical protein